MHRTTTASVLLATVAVSALSGCVTVQRPRVTGPASTAPDRPPVPRPGGSTEPRVVQAPAREALEMARPSRRPERTKPTAPSTPAATPTPLQPPSPRTHPRTRPDREPERPPRTGVPAPPGPAPAVSEVCALGKQYGGWRADNPEAQICEQAYGH